jgi:putative oxidoreductase
MSFGESIAPLFGRFVLAWFYITQAYRYGSDWTGTVQVLSMKGLPAAPAFLLIGLVGIVLGALSLIFGFRARIGALALFIITVWATLTMHDYWNDPIGVGRITDYDIFARNIAIAGGLLVLIGVGGGRFGMDGGGGGGGKKGGGGHGHH